MIREILSDNIGNNNNFHSVKQKSDSFVNFKNIIEKAEYSDSDTEDLPIKNKKETKTEQGQPTDSAIIICKECGAIYRNEDVTLCVKCGNDIAAQKQEFEKLSELYSGKVGQDSVSSKSL